MAASDYVNGTIKCLILPAALIGIIQGVIWVVLSLVSILYYNEAIEVSSSISMTSYGYIIYQLYLEPHGAANIELLVKPKQFNIMMYVYLVLSFIWLVVSIFMLWAVIRKKWNTISNIIICWSTLTICLALIDVSFMGVLARDLHKAHEILETSTPTPFTVTIPSTSSILSTTISSTTISPTTPSTTPPLTTVTSTPISSPETTLSTPTSSTTTMSPTTPSTSATTPTTTEISSETSSTSTSLAPIDPASFNMDDSNRRTLETILASVKLTDNIFTQNIYTAMGLVMSLAARGYILWILNVVFAITLAVSLAKIRNSPRPSRMQQPIIDAYDTGTRPFSLMKYDQVEIDRSYQNEGFKPDEPNIFSPRSTGHLSNSSNNGYKNPLSNSNRSSLVYGQTPSYPFELGKPIKMSAVPPPTISAPVTSPATKHNGKHAKIGKSGGRRSPPQPVPSPTVPHLSNMPYIPDPDYTPPESPVLKPRSVLRPQSNKYVY